LERIRGKFGLLYPGVESTDSDIYGLALYDQANHPTVETKSRHLKRVKIQDNI
jgi:hypothetical protein